MKQNIWLLSLLCTLNIATFQGEGGATGNAVDFSDNNNANNLINRLKEQANKKDLSAAKLEKIQQIHQTLGKALTENGKLKNAQENYDNLAKATVQIYGAADGIKLLNTRKADIDTYNQRLNTRGEDLTKLEQDINKFKNNHKNLTSAEKQQLHEILKKIALKTEKVIPQQEQVNKAQPDNDLDTLLKDSQDFAQRIKPEENELTWIQQIRKFLTNLFSFMPKDATPAFKQNMSDIGDHLYAFENLLESTTGNRISDVVIQNQILKTKAAYDRAKQTILENSDLATYAQKVYKETIEEMLSLVELDQDKKNEMYTTAGLKQ